MTKFNIPCLSELYPLFATLIKQSKAKKVGCKLMISKSFFEGMKYKTYFGYVLKPI